MAAWTYIARFLPGFLEGHSTFSLYFLKKRYLPLYVASSGDALCVGTKCNDKTNTTGRAVAGKPASRLQPR